MRLVFSKINEINLSDYEDKIFITFDMEWAEDEVLDFTLNLIESYKISCTFLVTHKTELLKKMEENSLIELGIHPNFNFLLNGDFRYGKDVKEVISYYKKIVPNALSVRSHCLTESTIILNIFHSLGLIYDLNTFIPFSSGITLKPFNYFTGSLIKVPHFWEDDVHVLLNWPYDVEKYINYPGLKVFDFHPVHIYLNTSNINEYYEYKSNKKRKKIKHGREPGIRDFFLNLVEKILYLNEK